MYKKLNGSYLLLLPHGLIMDDSGSVTSVLSDTVEGADVELISHAYKK